jgi:hypothetical protein
MITDPRTHDLPEPLRFRKPVMYEDHWQPVFQKAAPSLGLSAQQQNIETEPAPGLGEGQFSPDGLVACPAPPERSESGRNCRSRPTTGYDPVRSWQSYLLIERSCRSS